VTKSSYAVSPGLGEDELEKRLLGFKVKRLLDLGRVIFIDQQLSLKVNAV
jgi:hypothetical protein